MLTVSNPIVGAISTYSFSINNTNTIPANSQLHVYFPNLYNIAAGITCSFKGVGTNHTVVNSTYLVVEIPE